MAELTRSHKTQNAERDCFHSSAAIANFIDDSCSPGPGLQEESILNAKFEKLTNRRPENHGVAQHSRDYPMATHPAQADWKSGKESKCETLFMPEAMNFIIASQPITIIMQSTFV